LSRRVSHGWVYDWGSLGNETGNRDVRDVAWEDVEGSNKVVVVAAVVRPVFLVERL
jgi:hypothetical protein